MQQLQLQSTVKVGELSQLLQVSIDTIRRDLKSMEQSGLLKCVRGGACLPEFMLSFSNFTGREIVNSDLKREASRKALAYIREAGVAALSQIIAWAGMRLETNFSECAILGMVGAGGVGYVISNSLQGYDYGTAGTAILLVFPVAYCIERLFVRIKKRF